MWLTHLPGRRQKFLWIYIRKGIWPKKEICQTCRSTWCGNTGVVIPCEIGCKYIKCTRKIVSVKKNDDILPLSLKCL